MKSPKKFYLLKLCFLALLYILVTACGTNIPSPVPPNPYPTPTPTQDIQNIKVNIGKIKQEVARSEEIELPNCGGNQPLKVKLGTEAIVAKQVTVGVKASAAGGGEVQVSPLAKLTLELAIEGKYEQTYERANSRLDEIEMSASAGTHVVYVVDWYDQEFEEKVQYSASGQILEAPYIYELTVPKLSRSYPEDCTGEEIAASTPTSPPLSSPVPTQDVPMPTFTPTSVIKSDEQLEQEIEAFIRGYYDNINQQDYKTTWSMLSPKFISTHNSTGFDYYVGYWQTIDRVDVNEVKVYLLKPEKKSANVALEISYFRKDGVKVDSSPTFLVIWNEVDQQWLIDE